MGGEFFRTPSGIYGKMALSNRKNAMKKHILSLLALAAIVLPARAQQAVTIPRPDPAVAEFARGVKFTVAGYNGGEEVQTNFPVLVRISESGISGFHYSDFYADGSDLSLVDIGFVDAEGRGLAYDIDTWNTNGESLVWVNLPRMTNGTEFAMWYRSSKTGKTLNPTNAWAEYTGVWHLNESSGTTVKDSSTNTLDCAAQEHSSPVAAGKIGGSWRISDVYDRKAAGLVVDASEPANNAALNALGSTFHVSFWFQTTSTGNSAKWCALIGRRGSGSEAGWALQLHDTWNQLRVYGNGGEKNAYSQIGTMNNLAANVWAKIDVVWYADNNGKGRATTFYNGNQAGDSALWNNENAVSQVNNLNFVIGNFANLTSDRGLYGVMDEVRLGSGRVSAARVKADYDTVNTAAFLTAGSVVEVAVVERPVANLQVVDTGASHIQFGNAISSLGSSSATECAFNVKVWKTAESEPAGYTALATGLTVGALTGRVKGLTPETAYSYKIKVTNDEGVDSDEVTGSFTTSGVGVGGTGGDMTRVGDDWIHYFRVGFDEHGGITNDYVFTPPTYATSVRALVVGGGGPGGYYAGGGGGAGGYYYNETLGVTPGTGYSVHVGAGGVAATSATAYGSNGGNSSLKGGSIDIEMIGGGAGGNGKLNNQTATLAGVSGGSGGGTAWTGYAIGSGTADQGHDGGDVPAGQYQQDLAAGGGGAAAVGGSVEFSSNQQTKGSGAGGNGRSCDITGESLYYAGGGSGGAKLVTNQNGTGTAGAGGNGGGGKGGQYDNTEGSQYATSGEDGFGGGGGGGSNYSQDSYQGGNGGDGIVIIRYAAEGNGTDVAAPAIALESLERNDQTGVTTVRYRVAWAGAGYQDADVAVVWGFRKDELSNTNAIASSMIGRGTGAFTLPDQTKTVYVRALVTNAGGLSSESPKIVKIAFVDPEAPDVALPVVSGITGTGASFSAVVLGLGEGATSVDGVFQVCMSEDFEGTIHSFPVDAALSAAGSLTATATGLAPNTPYYVRVSATNDVPAVFETDPVAFRTGVPGAPSGIVITADPPAGTAVPAVTTTTIDAWGQLTTPGDNGATHANLCLEASTTSDFASVDATSTTTNGLTAGECAPFSLTGLQPATAYYLRLRMENDGRVVAYSTIVGPFSTLSPPVSRPKGTLILIRGGSSTPPAPHDYSADYLTFRVLTSGTICWKAFGSLTKTIEYKINNGEWTSITSTSDGVTISVAKGDLVRFRGSNTAYATSKSAYSGFEGGTATYDIEGNIMSLLYGDNFAESTTLPNSSYVFCSLFKKAPVISAEHLILPATTLKDYCYRALFSYCETLTKAPELSATTLAKGCYWYMFEHCAITEAPVLEATTLVAECYGHMFEGCGLLNKITCLATSGFGTSKCLEGWVTNVAGDGAFVKAANASSWATGVNGIPTGWIVCEDVLLLPPEVSFFGDTIELECDTTGAEIYYRLGQTGDFVLYTQPISIVADTVVEAYSTYQGHTSQTVTQSCVYVHETPFQRSNKDLPTWRYGGNTITTPYSVNGIDGHSSNYSKGTFAFDTSITLQAAQPTYLWFQHADQSADIYVNDMKVGTHWGGYNAFFFDISEYVRRGRNDIRVALCNTTRSTLAPYAGDFNFNATLGNVKLFTSPVLPAMEYGYDGFHITSTVSASSATTNATINVKTKVPVGADLKCIISDGSYAWTNTLASTGSEQTFTTTIAGDDLRLWNGTIDPHLYAVTLEIYKDGDLYHRYQRQYGFRYYSYVINETVNGQTYTGFLLNGQPYQLRGVCMHDDVEGKANALTDSDYNQEFAIIHELGCNFIRLAHYPHPKEVYDRCDQLGIVVQTEVPCVNKLQSTLPEDYYTHLTTQYIDMVEQHFNHPCIMFWGLSNETTTDNKDFGKQKIEEYYDLIKSMDTERMVGYVMSHSYDDPSGYYNNPKVDWFGCNLYVGWYIDKTSNDPSSRLNTRITKTITNHSKPLALSEYGCGGTQHCHSDEFKSTTTSGNNPRHDIEYQMWLHEGHIAAIRNYPQLLFTGQWQLFDIAVSSRQEGYTECLDGETATTNNDLKYLNNKGLVERDHVTKKDTFYLYKAEWNSEDKFVHICGKDYTKTTQRNLKCYTNDGDTLSLYVGNTLVETVTVTDHIAEFEATDFPSGVEIRVVGATSSDTVTFQ